jgi:hypothetical protein
MILQSYFDESERDGAGDPICVGGYVFKTSDYEKFRRRWRLALRLGSHRFKGFHMTDLYAGKGEYDGVSMADRAMLLRHAVDAIISHAYTGVGALVDRTEFELVAGPDYPPRNVSIYAATSFIAIQLASHRVRREKRCHLPILYVFERGHKYRAQVDAILTAIASDPRTRKSYQYQNHLFEDKWREYGLQAADLFAWMVTKSQIGGRPKSMWAFVEPIQRLGAAGDRDVILRVTGEQLKNYLHWLNSAEAGMGIQVKLGPRKRAFR